MYNDLWNKGYFVTSGHKFGGDFLLYLGDPFIFHALYIVRCIENLNEKIHPTEIVAFGRLASSVKKKAVLASFDDDDNDKLSYITINWMDS